MVDFRFEYRGEQVELTARDPKDCLYQEWVKTGSFYELPLLEKIASMEVKGAYVDVGANVGNHTVFFSRFARADHVIAFEPCADFIPALMRNISRIHWMRVSVCMKALLSIPGRGLMQHGQQAHENAWVIEAPAGGVEVSTLDIECRNDMFPPVGLLKVDVEGAELQVLQGAKALIDMDRPVIVIECIQQHNYEAINGFLGTLEYWCDGVNYFSGGRPTYIWEAR